MKQQPSAAHVRAVKKPSLTMRSDEFIVRRG